MPEIKDFVGDEQLTEILREKVANFDPSQLAPCLNCVQSERAVNKLKQYRGDFVYVHVRTSVSASGENCFTFMVRTDDEGYYLFVVQASVLADNWYDKTPSCCR